MTQFVFSGDTESIEQPQLDFIGKVLHERGFKGPDVTIEQVGSAGDNYGANVKRIVITENGTTFKMIAKLAPSSAMMREMGNLVTMFHNEHVTYTEILPKFRELQKSVGIPKEEQFRFPECYGSNEVAPSEVLLLEDLNDDDYVMLNRFKPLNNDCVKIVLKSFAVFHSLSHVLRHQEPETFAELKSKTASMFSGPMAERPEFKMFFGQMEDNTVAILQDEKYTKYVKGTVSNLFELVTELTKYDIESNYSIINQGDGWTNNILFQMEGGSPKNCCLIDYQLIREGNAAYDIMYMLFNSTSREQRSAHYHEFIDYYHQEMGKSLKLHGLDVSKVFPRELLDKDLKRYAKCMLCMSVMVSSFILRKNEDAEKFKEAMQNNTIESVNADPEKALESMHIKDLDTMALFKSRIEGVIDSFLEFGLLE